LTTKIIFMGTPDFAVPALTALMKAQDYDIVAVVTQPDRPSGRGNKLTPSPIKLVAEQAGLLVLQPQTLKDKTAVAQLAALQPDLMVVAAFGQILRNDVIGLPSHGCLNIHASLLPRWRGAAPVTAAIRAGDTETGITLMQIDEGLDTGPIISCRSTPLMPTHTGGTLTAELANIGAELLIETLPAWLDGKITPQPQNNQLATLAPRLKKEAGDINWAQSAIEIERQVRAFDPWPGTFTHGPRGEFKILAVELAMPVETSPAREPGTVFKHQRGLFVSTGQGTIRLITVHPSGKKAMSAEAMLNGQPELLGAKLVVSE